MCNLFADDTAIYVSGKTITEVKSKLQVAVNATINWFHTNKLTINPDKSFTMLVSSSKNPMKNAKLEIIVHNAILEQVDNFKYLGVTIDKNLTWSEHISAMCTKLANSLGALKRLSQFLPSQLLNKLYQSNIQSIIDYCCTVWGHSGSGNLSKLQIYQNRAAQIVCKYYDHDIHGIDPVRYLGWHTVEDRIKYFTSVLMFK